MAGRTSFSSGEISIVYFNVFYVLFVLFRISVCYIYLPVFYVYMQHNFKDVLIFNFMCGGGLPACMSVHDMHALCLQRTEEVIRPLR